MKIINKYFFLLFGVGVLYIDSLSPLGFADWVLYLMLLYVYARFAVKNDIIVVAVVYSIFIIIGFYLSPPAITTMFLPYLNRAFAIIILAVITVLSYKEKKIKNINNEILERINDVYLILDKEYCIKFVNTTARKLISYNKHIINKNFFEVFPEINSSLKDKFDESLKTLNGIHIEEEMFSKGIFFDLTIYPNAEGLTLIARDVSDLVKSERIAKKTLLEKEILLKEVHHRTKNNMQLILSLINLQKNKIENPQILAALTEIKSRVAAIASLHEKLYLEGNIHIVDMGVFIPDIIDRLDSAATYGLRKISHYYEIENIRLKLDHSIPIGLIINELYTNTLKYAFNNNDKNSVTIKMRFVDDTIVVYYKDNGIGLPEDYDLHNSTGLGSSIIAAFVEQLKGKIEYKNNYGAEFKIHLKALA